MTGMTFDFDDPSFAREGKGSFPYCQMVNPRMAKTGFQPFGLAVTAEQAGRVEFSVDGNGWEWTQVTLGGELKPVFITVTPRIVIIRRSPLLVKDRESGRILPDKTLEDYQADKIRYKICNKYLIFLVSEENKPLHDLPLALTLNGAVSASFGMSYSNFKGGASANCFRADLEKSYTAHRKQKGGRSMGDLFFAHGVYCPFFDAEERGVGSNSAWISATVGYDRPTPETLEKFLIPTGTEFSEQIKMVFNDNPDFGVFKSKDAPQPYFADDAMDYDDLAVEPPVNRSRLSVAPTRPLVDYGDGEIPY